MVLLSLPFSITAQRKIRPPTREEGGRSLISKSDVQWVVVGRNSHLGPLMKQVSSSCRDPPTKSSHKTSALCALVSTHVNRQSCKVKCADLQSQGLWVLEAHTRSLFNEASSFFFPAHFLGEFRFSHQDRKGFRSSLTFQPFLAKAVWVPCVCACERFLTEYISSSACVHPSRR